VNPFSQPGGTAPAQFQDFPETLINRKPELRFWLHAHILDQLHDTIPRRLQSNIQSDRLPDTPKPRTWDQFPSPGQRRSYGHTRQPVIRVWAHGPGAFPLRIQHVPVSRYSDLVHGNHTIKTAGRSDGIRKNVRIPSNNGSRYVVHRKLPGNAWRISCWVNPFLSPRARYTRRALPTLEGF